MTINRERVSTASSLRRSQSGRGTSSGKGGLRQRLLWRLFFGSVLALLAGALLILWPVFEAAGTALGAFMIVALLVLSLTPLFLLRSTLRRTAAIRPEKKEEVP